MISQVNSSTPRLPSMITQNHESDGPTFSHLGHIDTPQQNSRSRRHRRKEENEVKKRGQSQSQTIRTGHNA